MFALDDRQKGIIRQYPIDDGLKEFFKSYSEFISRSPSQPSCEVIAGSVVTDKGAERLVGKLLSILLGLDAAQELPAYRGSSRGFLSKDISVLYGQFPEQVNSEAIAVLLKHAVVGPVDDRSLWSAVYDLFAPRTPPREQNAPRWPDRHVLRDLRIDWLREYVPDSFFALKQLVNSCNQTAWMTQYYSRTLVFVQSSGLGKSRLADTFGKSCPMINFILREDGTRGYPPADSEILRFILSELPEVCHKSIFTSPSRRESGYVGDTAATIWNHSIAAGLLQACFEEFDTWVNKRDPAQMSLEQLAFSRWEEMAPLRDDYSKGDVAWESRLVKRKQFCQEVAAKGKVIAIQMTGNQDWRTIFDGTEPSQARIAMSKSTESKGPLMPLIEAAIQLERSLARFTPSRKHDPSFVVVFDEVASLFGEGKLHANRYIALNRVISCLKRRSMWFFMISTESNLELIHPPDNVERDGNPMVDPSLRAVFDNPNEPATLKRFTPFIALQLDVEDRRRMRDPGERCRELKKPLGDFSRQEHMATFGRPLWHAYTNPMEMHEVAKAKLTGGRHGRSQYNAKDEHHVLATLSFRICLDLCLQNPRTLPLTRTAVNSFMRVVISMDQETGVLDTIAPSEPVLARAAMELLCEGQNWANSIRTLTEELIQQTLVEKGLKGELYSRMLLILAQDWVRLGEYLKEHRCMPASLMPTFRVGDFLMALYAEEYQGQINRIDSRILDARMNFTHFVSADENLVSDVVPALCRDLLRRSAALQLSWNQPTYDKLIPFYCGGENEAVDPSKYGVILVQDKNKEVASTLESIFLEDFIEDFTGGSGSLSEYIPKASIRNGTKFVFNDMKNPILFLLFDMGVQRTEQSKSPAIRVCRSRDGRFPKVWAIHSRGSDARVFRCLRLMECEQESRMFFASTASSGSLHEELAERNRIFHRLHENFRYPESVSLTRDSVAKVAGKVGGEVVERVANQEKGNVEGEEDTPMADA
ncbi:MAG: hypothetical protein M1840_000911 [Geoglossum simile]|nr:MAG: hypothetical protein M1840_000911 [Geoglossum simile]